MIKIKHEVLVQNWERNIEQRINSGMTIKEWCQANNIMESQYYYWLKVVRCETIQQTENGLLPETQNTFVEIQEPAVAEDPAANTSPALLWVLFLIDGRKFHER